MIHSDKEISLIYPEHALSGNHMFISSEDFKTLFGNYLYNRELDLSAFMTDDLETIRYRQEIFADLLH